ncbi:MAG: S8 family serine peptidase [Oscillospiraceae bacterium]|nr:S8 family serine peptidase [Oscillospiraceae bacterium]
MHGNINARRRHGNGKLRARAAALILAALLALPAIALPGPPQGASGAPGAQEFRAALLGGGPFAQMAGGAGGAQAQATPAGGDPESAGGVETERYIAQYKDEGSARAFRGALGALLAGREALGALCEAIALARPMAPAALAAELDALGAGAYLEYMQPDYPVALSGLAPGGPQGESPPAEAPGAEGPGAGARGEAKGGARPVLVAMIDGGADAGHPLLQGKMDGRHRNFAAGGFDVFDESNPASAAHGTHVAGHIIRTAAGAGADASVLALQAFERGEAKTSDIVRALRYGEACGAEVICLSFGGPDANLALFDALAGAEALVVCAAGNGNADLGSSPAYPACYPLPNILSVASCDEGGGLSYFSNYSPSLAHIAAKGKNVASALPMGKEGPMSGTSVSAAEAAGAAAAAASLEGGTKMGAAGMKARLLGGADRLGCLQGKVGEGRRLNLGNALSGAAGGRQQGPPDRGGESGGGRGTVHERYALAGDIVQVETGDFFTLLLKEDGSVWGFGDNAHGEIGNGAAGGAQALCEVAGLAGIVEISAGSQHALARASDGTLWAWGGNRAGELGDGTYTDRSLPVQVVGVSGATAISAGAFNSMAVEDGAVAAWGNRAHSPCPAPPEWEATVGGNAGMAAVSAGNAHCLAVGGDGTAYGWGYGENGLPGSGHGGYYETCAQILAGVKNLQAGNVHSLAVTADGKAWAWGAGGPQLGLGVPPGEAAFSPQQVPLPAEAMAAAAGGSGFSLAIDGGRGLWAWGHNERGQLGLGDETDRPAPGKLGLEDIIHAAAGHAHAAALDDNGQLWLWGDNTYGQLSIDPGMLAHANEPFIALEVDDAFLVDVAHVAAGADHTLAVKTDGGLVAWGHNEHGQLGTPPLAMGETTYPVTVGGLPGIVKAAAGEGFSMALDENGRLWTWGANNFGQLGQGTKVDAHTPTMLPIAGVADIAAGRCHALALTDQGLVYSWGRNYDGQLGQGDAADRSAPQLIGSMYLSGAVKIAAGAQHSLALLGDGTVSAWGSGAFGQLGQGERMQRLRPSQIANLGGVAGIAAGAYHSLALKSDGTLLAWGHNEYGQLGLGGGAGATTPRTVLAGNGQPLAGIAQVAAGDYHSLALKSDGTPLAWGANTNHQLGDRTALHGPWPARPAFARRDAAQLAGGGAHTALLTGTGKVWCWGANYDGQAGRPRWPGGASPEKGDAIKPMRVMRELP